VLAARCRDELDLVEAVSGRLSGNLLEIVDLNHWGSFVERNVVQRQITSAQRDVLRQAATSQIRMIEEARRLLN
jgi:hypothetical protein